MDMNDNVDSHALMLIQQFRLQAYEMMQYWSLLEWKSEQYWLSNCHG